MRRGKRFKPGSTLTSKNTAGDLFKKHRFHDAEKGKQIGRYTDLLFRKVISGTVTLNPRQFRHQRCRFMMECLKKHGITCIATQVSVCDKDLGIKTELDGIGIKPSGAFVVLELKTTQYSIDMHKQTYSIPCDSYKVLSNGLPNTEEVAHQLQTGFGVYAFRNLLKAHGKGHISVEGRIIVCACDGAISYACQPMYVNANHFTTSMNLSSIKRSSSKKGTNAFIAAFPTEDRAQREILAFISSNGGTNRVVSTLSKQYGSFVVHGKRKNSYYLVGLMHDPEATSPASYRYKHTRLHLLDQVSSLRKNLVRLFKDNHIPKITTCIITFHADGRYTYYNVQKVK